MAPSSSRASRARCAAPPLLRITGADDFIPSLSTLQNPIQQHPITEVESVSLDAKNVTLHLPSIPHPWVFHCSSSSDAEAVYEKLHASKDLSGGSFAAASEYQQAPDSPEARPSGLSVATQAPTKAVRWAPSPTSPAAPEDDGEEHAVALYDFAADGGADELELREGEALVVIDKTGDGWWKVRNGDGQEGVVPEAYVELGGTPSAGGAGGQADDDDDAEEEERRREAAEAEAAAIAAANEEREREDAERRRQAEERRLRQEADEKRRRKDEERARRDEEARRCVAPYCARRRSTAD